MTQTVAAVDNVFIYILVFSVLLFFAIVFLMLYFAVRYRKARSPQPAEIPGHSGLEVLWIALATLLVLTMFFYGVAGFNVLRGAPKDSMTVKVDSRQWAWSFEYPNGLKSSDLIAPVGRNLHLVMSSRDVIHSFYVPALRIKQDTVPGMTTYAWFKAPQPGSYDILCAEYCGERHSAMMAKLIVLPPDQFAQWYSGQAVEAAGLPAPSATPTGQELLRHKGCLGCHSTDGSLLVGPTFKGLYGRTVEVITAGRRRRVTVDDAYIRTSILTPSADLVVGFRDIMPPGKPELTDPEIEQIVAYLHDLRQD
jgi:cytochrome c oxidase subunit 2